MPITFDGEMSIDITLDGEFGELQYYSDYKQYPGDMTVTPSQSDQTLPTNGLIMPGNLVVEAIPSNYGQISYSGSSMNITAAEQHDVSQVNVTAGGTTDSFYDVSDATLNNGNQMVRGIVGYGVGGAKIVGDLPERTSGDLIVSGNAVTAPAGLYPAAASVSVQEGTEGTPVATKGNVTNNAVTVTPSVTNTEGYIDGGTHIGEAVTVSASDLVSGTLTVAGSGTSDVTNYAEVSVPSGTAGTPIATKSAVNNHSLTVTPSVTNETGWITGVTETGEAITVEASELVGGTQTITSNATYDVTNLAEVVVEVEPKLMDLTNVIPLTVPLTIHPEEGYDGFTYAQINAIPTASYDVTATKGTVSNHAVTVTPSMTNTAGYVDAGTHTGTGVSVSASELVSGTKSIVANGTGIDVTEYAAVDVAVPGAVLQAKTNINPTTSSQTISPDTGYDGLSSVQINAMPSGTEGTPTATKGIVSNHSVSVTPSVTNAAGYINGGTHTGTAVSVSASELVSGTKSITANGTGIDVTNYAAVDVAVPGDENYIIYLVWNGSLDRWQVNKTFAQWKSAYNDGKVILLQPQDQLPRELCNWNYDSTDDVFYYYIAEYSSGDYVKYYIYTYGTGDVITEISRETDYNTSSADALSGHVLSGKGFFNSTGYHTGSIVTKTSSDLTANNLTVTAPAGYYENSASKTLTDANLTPGNVKKDVTIFGTTGTYEGSGGGGSVSPKQINFIDYDGTILYAYTKAEINAMTSESDLPANPSHTGLTAQGWNWTLAQIKAQLTAVPDGDVWVGQMYVTSSGDTEIDVRMQEGRLSPILTICVNGTVTVDWGDNTTVDTITGTSLNTVQTVPHTYTTAGDYTIVVHVTSGSFQFKGSSNSTLLRKNTNVSENRVYSNCIHAVRFGGGVTKIGDYAFALCQSLVSITIPKTVTNINTYAFSNCYSLPSITIPSGTTSIGTYAFYYCYSLVTVSLSGGITNIGNYAFQSCSTLDNVNIPSGVTSIGMELFRSCTSITSGVIPSGITSIGSTAFGYCMCLASITIPSTVTSIGGSAFTNCYGVGEYHLLPTTVPTLGTNTFSGIPSDCIIYVPSAKLNDYKTASQWSNYASYMVGE